MEQYYMLKNTIILLMGIAGTGKATIGAAMTQKNQNFRFVPHHSWIDPILNLFGDDESKVFWGLDEKGWAALNQARDVVFNTIADACPQESSFIITYELLANNPYHQDFFDALIQVVQKRKALFVPVRLICDLDALLKRVTNEQRLTYYKTRDTALIKKRHAESKVFFSHLPTEYTLDVTRLTPEQAASSIIQWVNEHEYPA